ncbi:hypothetical protein ACFPRL_14065 [Pseudoclavibacter helvolus]
MSHRSVRRRRMVWPVLPELADAELRGEGQRASGGRGHRRGSCTAGGDDGAARAA